MAYCKCGCGKQTKKGNKFINGHNSRVFNDEIRTRISEKLKGQKHSEEHKRKISETMKGKKPSLKNRIGSSKRMKESNPMFNKDHLDKMKLSRKLQWQEPSYRDKHMNENHPLFNCLGKDNPPIWDETFSRSKKKNENRKNKIYFQTT